MIRLQRKYPALAMLLLVMACSDKPAATPEPPVFFPVVSFLQGEIRTVDSLHPSLKKITTTGNSTDTASITIAEFYRLAANFLTPDINDPVLHAQYTESSFADQTIASATLTYSTSNKDLPLQRVDVIIQPDPVASDRVKSIYMEKSYRENDTGIVRKLYWKAGSNFQIITVKQTGSSVIKVVWNDLE